MPLSTVLQSILQFLVGLEAFSTPSGRQALVKTAQLENVERHIQWQDSQYQFFANNVPLLVEYPRQSDERNALVALLEAAELIVGPDNKAKCANLIKELEAELLLGGICGGSSFRNFVNRKDEWEEVVNSEPEEASQYYVFDAPPGYGKTCLLNYIQYRFKVKKWQCIYVNLSQCATLGDIAKYISAEVSLNPSHVNLDSQYLGVELGKEVAQHAYGNHRNTNGLCLLLDADGELSCEVKELVKEVKQFLIDFYAALVHNSEYFQDNFIHYRVVFAGRYISSIIKESDQERTHRFRRLKPFNYKVVRDEVIKTAFRHGVASSQVLDEFAAQLLFYSGGHPGVIDEILDEYSQRGIPPQSFFDISFGSVQRIVKKHARKIRDGISVNLRGLVSELAFYRHADHRMLAGLINSKRLTWNADEFDLRMKLTMAGIAGWLYDNDAGTVISDDIMFRILVWLQVIEGTADAKICYQNAKTDYENTFHKSMTYQEISLWVVDVLFCHLAGSYYISSAKNSPDLQSRESNKTEFFEGELPRILDKALGRKDLDPRDLQRSLLATMKRDEEFRFLVNYALRSEYYSNNEPYAELQRSIKAIFAKAMIRRRSNDKKRVAR